MKCRRWLLIGAVLLAPLVAEVREQVAYDYYTARVRDGESLQMALSRATPIRVSGRRYHGYARWQVDWRFWWTQTPSGSCRIDRVEVSMTGRIQLPSIAGGTAAQRDRFERYVRALDVHEQGHLDFGRRAAGEIERVLLGMTDARGCGQLEAAANEQGDRILERYQALEDRYDRETGHGRTQGADLGSD